MPVDVEKEDGKVKTVPFETSESDKTYRETAEWGKKEEEEMKKFNDANKDSKCAVKQKYEKPRYSIPSVTIELECSATRMFASAAAAIAVAALI